MRTSFLTLACLCIALGLAVADYDSYGSYGGGYGGGSYGGGYGGGYGFALPYAAPQGAAGGVGQGGLLMLIGLLFIFTLLLNSSLFNFTSSTSTSTPITLVG